MSGYLITMRIQRKVVDLNADKEAAERIAREILQPRLEEWGYGVTIESVEEDNEG